MMRSGMWLAHRGSPDAQKLIPLFFLKFKSAFPSEALVFSDLIKNWNIYLPPPQYILPYPLSRDGEDWDWTHLQQLLKKILTVLTDVTTVRK